MNHLTDSQLNEYLDNLLDKSTRREADSHLRSCVDCRARLDELQNVFTALTGLPEAHLARDLSPNILSHLPQKQPRVWTPFFAAQIGAALGTFVWISTQIAKLIPIISTFRFQEFRIPLFQLSIPNFQIPDSSSLFSIPHSLFTIDHPPFSIPTFHLSAFNLIFVAISVFVLWVIGNATLLRAPHEVQK